MNIHAVTCPSAGWALFLDVDGTLLEIAPTPQDVLVPERLKYLLNSLCDQLGYALALVSGRSVANLDALFAPDRYTAAGVHGCERREPSGQLVRPPLDPVLLDDARAQLAQFALRNPALVLEDKGYGLAVHFRRQPQLAEQVQSALQCILQSLPTGFTLQAGSCVYEIRPEGWTKASAVQAFMMQAPFHARTPVFIGDDLTDESAFAWVNEHHGWSIKVGGGGLASTCAQYALPCVAAVIEWLEALHRALPAVSKFDRPDAGKEA